MNDERLEQRMQTIRLCGALAGLAGCVFAWVALLTFDPFDWPSSLAWPPNEPALNRCGKLGGWLAYQAMHYLGIGSYAAAALLTLGAGARVLRGPLGDWPLRLGGLMLFVTAVSGTGTLLLGGPGGGRLFDGGGVLGVGVDRLLSAHVSNGGAWLLILASLVIGLLLAADDLLLRIPALVARIGAFGRVALAGAGIGLPDDDDSDEREPLARRPRRGAAEAGPSLLRSALGLLGGAARGAAAGGRRLLEMLPADAAEAESQDESAAAESPGGAPARGERARRRKAKPDNDELFTDDDAEAAAVRKSDDDSSDDGDPAASKEAAGAARTPLADAAETAPVARDDPSARRKSPRSAPDESAGRAGAKDAPRDEAPAALADEPARPEPAAPVVRSLGANYVGKKPPPSPWPKELGDYVLPPLDLLQDPEYHHSAEQESVVREKAQILERTLQDFRFEARVVEIDTGPVITMYELDLAAGIKVSQIASLANDIARALKAPAVRVVAPIPGKNTVGIEVPNTFKEKVRIKELITLSGVKPTKMSLPLFLGKDASGNPLITDLAAMPHLLIAGTTGSGKSVCINTLVLSILMTQRPDHVKLVLVDPKMVEMSVFKDVPHLMCPIVTDMQRAEMILEWAATKMDERYELLAEAGVRHVASFNRMTKDEIYARFNPSNDEERARIPTHLPYIVIIIDELADLMMMSGKQVEHHLCRIAQKSRAVGIHVILATQRPQANVVTGLIKSNLPSRIAFRVASRMDSRIVLDQNGAEVLMGQGDMLFLPPGTSKLMRAQGTYIEDDELKKVLDDLKSKAQPEFHHELVRMKPPSSEGSSERDELFDQAVDIILETRRGSVSLLQRRLEIGYSRASRLVDQMYEAGIVGEYKGSQSREVIMTKEEWAGVRKHRDREVSSGGFAADAEVDTKYAVADDASDVTSSEEAEELPTDADDETGDDADAPPDEQDD